MGDEANGVGAKLEKCSQSLLKKSAWSGAMVALGKSFKPSFMKGVNGCPDEAHLEPWLHCFRESQLRVRPEHPPLPLFGALITALSDHVWVQLVPVEEVAKAGISIQDLGSFAETDSGKKLMSGDGADGPLFVRLHSEETLWVPFGWQALTLECDVAAAIAPKPVGSAAKKRAAAEPERLGAVLVSPVCSVQLAETMSQGTRAAMVKVNADWMQKQQGLKVWASRSKSFDEFCKLLVGGD